MLLPHSWVFLIQIYFRENTNISITSFFKFNLTQKEHANGLPVRNQLLRRWATRSEPFPEGAWILMTGWLERRETVES